VCVLLPQSLVMYLFNALISFRLLMLAELSRAGMSLLLRQHLIFLWWFLKTE